MLYLVFHEKLGDYDDYPVLLSIHHTLESAQASVGKLSKGKLLLWYLGDDVGYEHRVWTTPRRDEYIEEWSVETETECPPAS